ncbi:hypothetical protein [Caulobacter segnis]|uniref:hypothetical protein n=1 Tax=Caulobacter segnis TaxID=88688 RepID=UPI001CC1A0BA|nr:hypothetical protein [Caulobacter segnis]UAL10208.1 hypothetical protein K8940_20960 [Caulobacter segnis]
MSTEPRELGLRRTTAADRHLAMEVLRFSAAYGENQVIALSLADVQQHITFGQMVLLFEDGPRRRLIGVGLGAPASEGSLILEIVQVIVHPQWRGRRLALLLLAGALIGQLINDDEPLEAIAFACAPTNTACVNAASRITAMSDPSTIVGAVAGVDTYIQDRRVLFVERMMLSAGPIFGFLTLHDIRNAARAWLQMNGAGLVIEGADSIARLDGDWCSPGDPRREGVACYVRFLAGVE